MFQKLRNVHCSHPRDFDLINYSSGGSSRSGRFSQGSQQLKSMKIQGYGASERKLFKSAVATLFDFSKLLKINL